MLRFDCFEHEPHYHLAWSYRSEPFIRIDATDPFSWALGKIGHDVNALLAAASAEPMDDVELGALEATLDQVRAEGDRILANL